MILISDEDYFKAQQICLEKGLKDFIDKIDKGDILPSKDYDMPKACIINTLKFALVGYQNYARLYDYANKIILDNSKIQFFNEPHTKDEVREFVDTIN